MTVTKFDYSKRIRDLMKDRREEEKILANKKKNTNNRDSKKDTLHKVEDHRTRLERLIPEFYVNQKTISDDSEEEEETNKSKHSDSSSDFSELDEKQKKELFDRLKTKNKFFKTNNLKANLNQTDVILPFLPTSRIKLGTGSNNDTINSPEKNYKNYNKKYEYENGNSAVYGINGMNYQREGLIDYDPRIINIKKIREKFNIIKNIGEKKDKIKGVDLFIYDKKKWQKKNLREVYFFLIKV